MPVYSSSFELRLTHCDERPASEGDKHIHWVRVVSLLFVEEEIERERKQFLEQQPLNTCLKVKPCETVKSQYMTPHVLVLVCGDRV